MEVILMSKTDVLTIDAKTLVKAWQDALPEFIKPTGECSIQADEKFSDTLLIHIKDDGRSHYSFDFRVKYVDDREIHVEFVDVEKGEVHADEQTDIIQSLVKDYIRHIRECAQSLKGVTKQ